VRPPRRRILGHVRVTVSLVGTRCRIAKKSVRHALESLSKTSGFFSARPQNFLHAPSWVRLAPFVDRPHESNVFACREISTRDIFSQPMRQLRILASRRDASLGRKAITLNLAFRRNASSGPSCRTLGHRISDSLPMTWEILRTTSRALAERSGVPQFWTWLQSHAKTAHTALQTDPACRPALSLRKFRAESASNAHDRRDVHATRRHILPIVASPRWLNCEWTLTTRHPTRHHRQR